LHGFYGWSVGVVGVVGRTEDRGFGVLHGFHGWSVGVVGW
jgi:hypothetical protein